jgi:hypothetical protein
MIRDLPAKELVREFYMSDFSGKRHFFYLVRVIEGNQGTPEAYHKLILHFRDGVQVGTEK